MAAQAETDLAEIWVAIAETSPETANAFVGRIEEQFEPLRRHPQLGPSRANLAPGLRAHFYRNYVIYYQPTDIAVIIVRVLHGARDSLAMFGKAPEDLEEY